MRRLARPGACGGEGRADGLDPDGAVRKREILLPGRQRTLFPVIPKGVGMNTGERKLDAYPTINDTVCRMFH